MLRYNEELDRFFDPHSKDRLAAAQAAKNAQQYLMQLAEDRDRRNRIAESLARDARMAAAAAERARVYLEELVEKRKETLPEILKESEADDGLGAASFLFTCSRGSVPVGLASTPSTRPHESPRVSMPSCRRVDGVEARARAWESRKSRHRAVGARAHDNNKKRRHLPRVRRGPRGPGPSVFRESGARRKTTAGPERARVFKRPRVAPRGGAEQSIGMFRCAAPRLRRAVQPALLTR